MCGIAHQLRIVVAVLLGATIAAGEASPLHAQRTGVDTLRFYAQSVGADHTAEGASSQEEERERGPWWTLWSWRSPHDRILVGQFSTHLYKLEEGWDNNYAIGVVAGGFFGATFITTHGPRGWAVGFERAFTYSTAS